MIKSRFFVQFHCCRQHGVFKIRYSAAVLSRQVRVPEPTNHIRLNAAHGFERLVNPKDGLDELCELLVCVTTR